MSIINTVGDGLVLSVFAALAVFYIFELDPWACVLIGTALGLGYALSEHEE